MPHTLSPREQNISDKEFANNKWHVGKEVPLALVVMFILQTAGAVWWLSQMASKIDGAVGQLQEFKIDRYTKEDGRRDRDFLVQISQAQSQRDTEQDRRLAALERAIERTMR